MCRLELVIDATMSDDPSLVGEECHIVSGQVGGPRHNDSFPAGQIDSYARPGDPQRRYSPSATTCRRCPPLIEYSRVQAAAGRSPGDTPCCSNREA